jgi:hypothetical protein
MRSPRGFSPLRASPPCVTAPLVTGSRASARLPALCLRTTSAMTPPPPRTRRSSLLKAITITEILHAPAGSLEQERSYSEPSARVTVTVRSSSSPSTQSSQGLQHTSQSCTRLPWTSRSRYTSTSSPQYGQLTTNSSFIRLPGSSSSAAEAGRAGSAPSHTRRTLSAACILESGTRESRAIPSGHGRCAGNRGRSNCRSPEGSSRSGRRTRGRSRCSQELQGRCGRRRCHCPTVALVAEAPRRIRCGAEGICETSPVNIADTIDGARRAPP